jgi:hypothetical protein
MVGMAGAVKDLGEKVSHVRKAPNRSRATSLDIQAGKGNGPDYALIDGNRLPSDLNVPAETLIKGAPSVTFTSVCRLLPLFVCCFFEKLSVSAFVRLH